MKSKSNRMAAKRCLSKINDDISGGLRKNREIYQEMYPRKHFAAFHEVIFRFRNMSNASRKDQSDFS